MLSYHYTMIYYFTAEQQRKYTKHTAVYWNVRTQMARLLLQKIWNSCTCSSSLRTCLVYRRHFVRCTDECCAVQNNWPLWTAILNNWRYEQQTNSCTKKFEKITRNKYSIIITSLMDFSRRAIIFRSDDSFCLANSHSLRWLCASCWKPLTSCAQKTCLTSLISTSLVLSSEDYQHLKNNSILK